MLVGFQQAANPFNKIAHVTKAASLPAISINGNGLAGECLVKEIRERAPVIQAHPRAISIEDAYDTRIQAVVTVIGHSDGFGEALGLVINSARANLIHMAPIRFRLRADFGIAITFRSGGQKKSCLLGECQAKGVMRAKKARFHIASTSECYGDPEVS